MPPPYNPPRNTPTPMKRLQVRAAAVNEKRRIAKQKQKQKGIFNILYKLVLNYCLEKRVADKKETKKKPRKKGRK